MAIFTMSDLHLSLGSDKPMEVFGAAWDNYTQRIYENWSSVVGAEDTVLIGGDISWAMHLKDCKADFEFLNSLPGNKLLYKGNHDYWWESMTKMNAFLSDNGYTTLRFMQNNAIVCEDSLVCGTRGWCLPGDGNNSEDDIRIYAPSTVHSTDSATQKTKNHYAENLVSVPIKRYVFFIIRHLPRNLSRMPKLRTFCKGTKSHTAFTDISIPGQLLQPLKESTGV